jgi:DnaK suppressor protein
VSRKPSGESREQLLARRAELQERLDAIKRDYAAGLDRDQDERAVQLENADVLQELGREALEELNKLEQTLRTLGN